MTSLEGAHLILFVIIYCYYYLLLLLLLLLFLISLSSMGLKTRTNAGMATFYPDVINRY